MSKPKRLVEGRLSAAFFVSVLLLLLAGCGRGLLFHHSPDFAHKASSLPYASISLKLDRREALLVLGYLARNDAWFLASGHVSLLLRDGYLSQVTGTPQPLLMTQLRQHKAPLSSPPWQQAQTGTPFHYQILREWRDAKGLHAGRADASLLCAATSTVKLLLLSLPLQACTETLIWSDGQTTVSTLWRSPTDKRLWKVETQPWPGAPTFAWQVAKSWW